MTTQKSAVRPALDLSQREYWEFLIKKSVSRFFLLGLLYRRPMHGYDIARNIETCCEGWARPTDGMIYPTIKELLEGGYIECVPEVSSGRQRKVCHLTPRGVEAYLTAAQVWAGVLPYLQASVNYALRRTDSDSQPAACACAPSAQDAQESPVT